MKINENCNIQGNSAKYVGDSNLSYFQPLIDKVINSESVDKNYFELYLTAFPNNNKFKYLTKGDITKLINVEPIIVPFSKSTNGDLRQTAEIDKHFYFGDLEEIRDYVKIHYPNASERLRQHWFAKYFEYFQSVFGAYIVFKNYKTNQFYFALFIYDNIETSDIVYHYGLEIKSYNDIIGTSDRDLNENYYNLNLIK